MIDREQLINMDRGWTPSQVRALIRQHYAALDLIEALDRHINCEEDAALSAIVAALERAQIERPLRVARSILKALAVVHAHAQEALEAFRKKCETPP